MFTPSDLLLGGILPGLLSLIIAAIAWRVWQRRFPAGIVELSAPTDVSHRPSAAVTTNAWVAPLAVATAYLVSHLAMTGRTATGWSLSQALRALPATVDGWLVYAALIVGLAAAICELLHVHQSVRLPILGLLIVGAAWTQIGRAVQNRWHETGEQAGPAHAAALQFAVATIAGTLLVWLVLDALARRAGAARMAMVLFIVAAGGAIVLATSGTLSVGQFSGALSAALAGTAIAAALSPGTRVSPGMVAVFAALFAPVLLRGYFAFDPPGSHMSIGYVAVLALAPLLAWVTAIPPLNRLRPWQQAVIEAVIVAIPVAIAAVLSVQAFLKAQAEDQYY